MKFGINVPNFNEFGDAARLSQLAREAEEAGWDGFFIWDHIARPYETEVVDPWIALACIAMKTSSIRIGTMVTPLPRRRPWKVARETVSIDRLSNGRFIFGVGIGSKGGSQVEWAGFGEEMNLTTRGEMLDEALEIISGLWSGDTFSLPGKHYHVQDARFLPPPVQSPRIPVWIGGYWPNKAPFRRATKWDGIFPLFRGDEESHLYQLREVIQYVQDLRQDESSFDVAYLGTPTPGDDLDLAGEIVAPYAEAGATWWMEPLNPTLYGSDWEGAWPYEIMRERVIKGPPR
jgi:alkanesulfonate monooxygenase SsuD/methylene tetrahydromethanopterin reductase-like flavin-dependent oxidoreductase (luciferase family)